ncbi:MAG: hypothetical protein ACLFR8_08600 [Alkalispirochaeta sp.]
MIDLRRVPELTEVAARLDAVWEAGLRATTLLRDAWSPTAGTPVYTEAGKYTTRGWTEWTQGFQFGNALYLYEATGDTGMLTYGRRATVDHMAHHLTHIGVHDHGFNNVSTYGNLLRMMGEGTIPVDLWEAEFYRLALKVTGAVQAARWTPIRGGGGYVHTFNGPHSLFSDTIRSMRALAVSHQLGHVLMGEQDSRISLLERLVDHATATAEFNVYYGRGRDGYDVRGRTVHESIFNVTNGVYRCPGTQQGYSPFTTWTRGLAWIAAGYPEQLEWIQSRPDEEFAGLEAVSRVPGGDTVSAGVAAAVASGTAARARIEAAWLRTACAVSDFYLTWTPTDGIPYWDTGAPGLEKLGGYLDRPADPYNEHEPVDSSAAAITAQGLLRLALYLEDHAERLAGVPLDLDGNGPRRHDVPAITERAARYRAAGLIAAHTLFGEPYLSTGADHQGILLHSIYHQPNRWDYVAPGQKIANGESCMWGDYHLLELAVMVKRLSEGRRPQRFFDIPAAGASHAPDPSGSPGARR